MAEFYTKAQVDAQATYIGQKMANARTDIYLYNLNEGANNDNWAAIQAAIYAGVGRRVVLPYGKFGISYPLHLPKGTYLDLSCGATLVRNYNWAQSPGKDHTHASMLTPEDETSFEDVTIVGGALDANGHNYEYQSVIMGAQAWSRVKIIGVDFLNTPTFHALDIASTPDKVLVQDCRFLGWADLTNDSSRGFSEAIQTDPNGTGLIENLTITGCIFGDNPDNTDPRFGPWACGVGNHSANNPSVVTKNLRVLNCTFNGMTYAGVRLYATDNATISGCTFDTNNNGIMLSAGTGTKTQGCVQTLITGNQFLNCTTNDIYIVPSTAGTKTDYKHRGITISGNTFVGSNWVIRGSYFKGLTISGNSIDGATGFATLTDECAQITVTGNTGDEFTSAVFYLANALYDATIANNNISNMDGRFVHGVGLTGGRLTITGNALTNCVGPHFVEVGGTFADVTVTNNNFSASSSGLIPTGDELVKCSNTGWSEVLDNATSDLLISKINYVGKGILRSRVLGGPEGTIRADIGSMVYRNSGGGGYQRWYKTTNGNNTGWKRVDVDGSWV